MQKITFFEPHHFLTHPTYLLPPRTRPRYLNRIRIDQFVLIPHLDHDLQNKKKKQKTNPKKKLEENEPNSIPVAEQIPR